MERGEKGEIEREENGWDFFFFFFWCWNPPTVHTPCLYNHICAHTHYTTGSCSPYVRVAATFSAYALFSFSIVLVLWSFSNIIFLHQGPLCSPARPKKQSYTSQETHILLQWKRSYLARKRCQYFSYYDTSSSDGLTCR